MPNARLVRLPDPPPIEPVTPLARAGLPDWPNALVVLPDGDTCVIGTRSGLVAVSLAGGTAGKVSTDPVTCLALLDCSSTPDHESR